MNSNIKQLVKEMTIGEKVSLCSGEDFWHLRSIGRLEIPRIMMSDGPHGLRKQKDNPDHLGHNDSIKAVCFPAACATGSSFDKELLYKMGAALGEECQAENVAVILGPAINIKRSPLCGRNFEYVSEDPYLAGKIAASFIRGIQSKNVGASLKHFAANNQEFFRMTVDVIAGKRTLREIYLTAFEIAVKEAQPWTVMCSYNKINGIHSPENHWLLTEVLREEWGFQGCVVSDWYGTSDRVIGMKAGLDLEMPYSGGYNDKALALAVKNGNLPETVLDTAVERILTLIFKYADNRLTAEFDYDAHHALSAEIEKESAVLLKNEGGPDNGLLPLKKDANILFVGAFAEKPRFQGGGSSHINAQKITSALDAAKARGIAVKYVEGFTADQDTENPVSLKAAVKEAARADVVVVFAGLPDNIESECYDREHMKLPECQNTVINALAEAQPNIVVVLHNGSPVEMPWIGKVKSVLELYLGGQAVGEAAISLLFGETNPSGKLAETFPLRIEDTPAYENFPGDRKTVHYHENVFIGYRYYDYREMNVLFPFGHGLSYTAFQYGNLAFDKSSIRFINGSETLRVTVDVTNIGKVAGKEVVQLYVEDKTDAAIRPLRELKGFEKLSLAPGETKQAVFTLNERSFAWYNTELNDWYCASGNYRISIGSSSRDIRLYAGVSVTSNVYPPFHVDLNTTVDALLKDPRTRQTAEKIFSKHFDQLSWETGLEGLGSSNKWNERAYLEAPLRHFYMAKGMPHEEVEKLIDTFNKLLC
jgi:beta-glucosidase